MSEGYSQQQPTMVWNTQMKYWETSQVDLLSGLSVPFSETWQTSGMMRNGQVFELRMQEHRTTDSESLLLRSPKASEGEGGALGEAEALKRGNTVGVRDQVMDLMAAQGVKVSRQDLLGTPRTSSANAHTEKQVVAGAPKARIEDQVQLLQTPVASEGLKAPAQQSEEVKKKTGQVWLSNQAKDMQTNWGRFEPAIRRWEEVIGRLAPVPTKPDGKDGAHRLSSRFTEWMMGLPDGWITEVGLTRNEELKACGNGVVPQQAELALRVLLEDVPISAEGGLKCH